MAEQSTFIKLDRNIMRWRWWHDHNTLIVFLVLLMNANIQEHGFNEVNIRRGEVACSYSTISQQANLTIQQVRTAFLHLKSTGEITTKSYRRFQVITIVNYDRYQSKQQAKQHDEQQAINRLSTGYQQQYKNIKNGKNGKNIKESLRSDCPSDSPKRGTDAFRNQSHLLLKRDEGDVDDIPMVYRDGTYQSFKTFAEYHDWRNQ